MKRNLIAVLSFLALIAVSATRGQAPDAKDVQKVLGLVQELKVRQVQIADNQAKIDAKLIDLEQSVRTARIFVGRTGGAHKPPPPKK